MSFRANLQYLRAQRNLTQATIGHVAWRLASGHFEMGIRKGYPEMDKLLMICDLFGCTLDDLVLGDVSASVNVGAAARGAAEATWLGCQNRNRGGSRGTRVYEGC